MGNRVGVIFHENYKYFSPLIYDHFGADNMLDHIHNYIEDYEKKYSKDINDGHLYSCGHMLVGFLRFIEADKHIRVENLSDDQIENLKFKHNYPNFFEGGCFLVNIDKSNCGNIENYNTLRDKNDILLGE